MAVVYFLRRSSDGALKVGTTVHLGQRLRAHAAEARHKGWGELTFLGAIAGHRELERALHLRLAHGRNGQSEWFAWGLAQEEWLEVLEGMEG